MGRWGWGVLDAASCALLMVWMSFQGEDPSGLTHLLKSLCPL